MLRRIVLGCLVASHASAAPAESPLPPGGRLVASTDMDNTGVGSHLYINRITTSGIEPVLSVERRVISFGWTDASTLWTLDGVTDPADEYGLSEVWLTRFDNGREAQRIQVDPKIWRLPHASKYTHFDPILALTASNGVWLGHCTAVRGFETCARRLWLRLDTPKIVKSKTKPRGALATTWDAEAKPLAFPAAERPPADYSVTRTRVTIDGKTYPGVTCSGPGVSSTWPVPDKNPEYLKPQKITWLRAQPAVVRISGPGPGDVFDAGPSINTLTYVDCEEVWGVEWFAPGVWGIEEVSFGAGNLDVGFIVHVEDLRLGRIPGSEVRVAPE